MKQLPFLRASDLRDGQVRPDRPQRLCPDLDGLPYPDFGVDTAADRKHQFGAVAGLVVSGGKNRQELESAVDIEIPVLVVEKNEMKPRVFRDEFFAQVDCVCRTDQAGRYEHAKHAASVS